MVQVCYSFRINSMAVFGTTIYIFGASQYLAFRKITAIFVRV